MLLVKIFVSIAGNIPSSIKYSKNNLMVFLIQLIYIFSNPTDEIEVTNLIMSLRTSKAINLTSLRIEILFHFETKCFISTDYVNFSLSPGVFPLILVTTKVVPV